jgi:hypothetical protein
MLHGLVLIRIHKGGAAEIKMRSQQMSVLLLTLCEGRALEDYPMSFLHFTIDVCLTEERHRVQAQPVFQNSQEKMKGDDDLMHFLESGNLASHVFSVFG